jgi:hypothetical protein
VTVNVISSSKTFSQMKGERPACIAHGHTERSDCDAKGIDVLNEQSELKRMQDMGWRVIQVEACGVIDVVIQDIGSGEDNG